ncbi:MAG: RibD family protein [Cyanobacteria bacterium CRU_2_1]|nr:RibD family protein [Cyanobacteria bacterium RU_5_0]NJR61149.1 RibD family protein [Cyanobacteria bacterium CRU_2_1]
MRPYTTVVLAMSIDGKIADARRSPARFGSAADKAHLETQIAKADGVLFGAATLRAYQTTFRITNLDLLQQRQQQGKPLQPIHIVCSRSAQLNPKYPFFRQPLPRWLLTTIAGAEQWQGRSEFDRILTPPLILSGDLDWEIALHELKLLGIQQLVIAGGGELVAALLAIDQIDEFWLTVCPLILGGSQAPTPVEGSGFMETLAPRLELLSVKAIDHEVFLNYCLRRKKN